jgi:hypothetical protein
VHQPLEVDWSLERGARTITDTHRIPAAPLDSPADQTLPRGRPLDSPADQTLPRGRPLDSPADQTLPRGRPLDSPADQMLARGGPLESGATQTLAGDKPAKPPDRKVIEPPRPSAFATFWEFAVALNRSDPAAVALAGNGAGSDIPIDGSELRKLLGMMWFRTVLGRLSPLWRDRVFSVLIESATVPDHAMKLGRRDVHLRELSYEQLQEIDAKTIVPDWIRPDLDLLVTVGRFWGADAVKRFRFVEAPARQEPSMMESLLEKLRG